jgi:hypothetical protein
MAATHRVHNDHLETMVELGIFGFVLFLAIIYSLDWANNIILGGAVIAFAVHGLFFFPLREAHTAIPFFTVVGLMSAGAFQPIPVDPIIAIVLIVICIRIMGEVIRHLKGLDCYDKFVKCPTEEGRKHFIRAAISHDPFNGLYLANGYYHHVIEEPDVAFMYAQRCLMSYDGGKVKWGICDQFARAAVRFGGFNIARQSLIYALHICPGFKQADELLKQLDKIELEGKSQEVEPCHQ